MIGLPSPGFIGPPSDRFITVSDGDQLLTEAAFAG
jgi:hypothetical protein